MPSACTTSLDRTISPTSLDIGFSLNPCPRKPGALYFQRTIAFTASLVSQARRNSLSISHHSPKLLCCRLGACQELAKLVFSSQPTVRLSDVQL